jgi:quercetin dioxygenase-like cupin family protein
LIRPGEGLSCADRSAEFLIYEVNLEESMIVKRSSEVAAQSVDGAPKASIRWVLSKEDGTPNFAMRVIEVQAGGATPHHSHATEHEVYILEGEGTVHGEGAEHPLKPGMAVFVPPHEKHQFVNTGSGLLRFICVVPHD